MRAVTTLFVPFGTVAVLLTSAMVAAPGTATVTLYCAGLPTAMP